LLRFSKVRVGGTPTPTRETRALPGDSSAALCVFHCTYRQRENHHVVFFGVGDGVGVGRDRRVFPVGELGPSPGGSGFLSFALADGVALGEGVAVARFAAEAQDDRGFVVGLGAIAGVGDELEVVVGVGAEVVLGVEVSVGIGVAVRGGLGVGVAVGVSVAVGVNTGEGVVVAMGVPVNSIDAGAVG
jgi:hypothetical protein